MSVGEKIAALRKEAGMTQNQLSQELNLSAQAISKWENDLAEPDIATLKKLAEIFNTTVSCMLGENHAESTEQTPAEEQGSGLFKLTLTEVNASNSFPALRLIRDICKTSLVEAKNISATLPYTIINAATEEQASRIKKAFFDAGATLISEPVEGCQCAECKKPLTSKNMYIRETPIKNEICTECAAHNEDVAREREAAETKAYLERVAEQEKIEKEIEEKRIKDEFDAQTKKILKKRFIIANVVAGIFAIAAFVLVNILTRKMFGPVPGVCLGVYAAISTFTGAFMTFYNTFFSSFVEWLWLGFCESEGLFVIFSLFFRIGLLPFLAGATLLIYSITPFMYPISLKKRIERMKTADKRDNPEFFSFYKEKL
jgi:transcriptional regulator with XRE-family HTH domain